MRVSYAHVPHWLITKLPKPLCGLSKPAEKAAIEALKDNLENRTYLKKAKQKYIEKTDTIKTYLKIIDKAFQFLYLQFLSPLLIFFFN